MTQDSGNGARWTNPVGFDGREMTTIVEAPREIAPRIWWLASCLQLHIAGKQNHVHNSPYLVVGDDRTLLWDTGHPASWAGTEHYLDALLRDRPLDYVVPSHPEMPHWGNVHRLLARYPEAVVLGDVRDYHLMFPQYADRLVELGAGTEIDLGGGQSFLLLDAIVKDLPSSQWGYAPAGKVMFTSDAFAYAHYPPVEGEERPVHGPGDCTKLASEHGRRPDEDQIVWIVSAAFYWARFVSIERYREPVEALLREHPTELIAPAHGAVVDDMTLLPQIWEALARAYDPLPEPGLRPDFRVATGRS